jgi:hypothetical protein
MSTLKRWCLLIALYLSTQFSFGQMPFPNDPNWVPQLIDEFNQPSVNNTNWNSVANPCCHICEDNQLLNNPYLPIVIIPPAYPGSTDGSGLMISSVVSGNGTGICNGFDYSVAPWNDSFYIQTADIISQQQFTYGYFEANIMTQASPSPGCSDPRTCNNFDQAFWLYQGDLGGSSWPNTSVPIVLPSCYTNEIDIAEILTYNPFGSTDQLYTRNVHINLPNQCISPVLTPEFYCDNTMQNVNCPFPDLYTGWWCKPTQGCQLIHTASTQFHTYGLDWEPDHLTFYLDGAPVQTEWQNSNGGVPSKPMSLILNIGPGYNNSSGWATTSAMFVDYVHVYQLNYDCKNPITFANNAQITGFTYAVKSQIIFGNGTSVINIGSCTPPTNKAFIFRSAGGFIINPNFTVPKGQQFTLIPTVCPN